MAQSVIGALRVNLGLDSAQFQRGLSDAQKRMQNVQRQFRRIATVAGVVGTALGGLTISTARAAQEISTLSKVANTTPRTLQRWAAATNTVGINQEKLSDILKDVNDRVGDFLTTGGGPMADFFENIAPKVGVTAEAFRGLSGPQALQLYVESLEKAGVGQQEMTFYMEAMASDATALLPLLRNNGAEMGRLADQADRLGTVLDDKAVASLAKANAAFKTARDAVGGLGDQIAATFAPALQKTSEYIANAVAGLSRLVRALRETGGAMSLLKDVSVESFDRIVTAFKTVPTAIQIGANEMSAFFLDNLAKMARAFVDFTADVADGLNAVFGTNLTPLGASMASSLEGAASDARSASESARGEMASLTASLSAPMESIEAFKNRLFGVTEGSDAAASSIGGLSTSLGSSEGGGLSSAASGAAAATEALSESIASVDVNPAVEGLTRISDGMIDTIAQGGNLLQSFTNMLQQMALEALKADIGNSISGLFGGATSGASGFLGLLGGARAMGGPVKAGVPYLVNENTPNSEVFVPSQSGAVLNVPQAQKAMSGGQGAAGPINITVPPAQVTTINDPRLIDRYNTSPAGEKARARQDARMSDA